MATIDSREKINELLNGTGEPLPSVGRLVPAEYEFNDEPDEPDAFARIRAFCDSGSSTGMLGIYRALPQKKEQFICKLDATEFEPELIKGRFGGGDYIIKGYDDRSKIRLKQHLSIEGAPIIETLAAPASTTSASDIGALIAAMQEGNRQMLAGLAQIMQHRAPEAAPEKSRVEMLEELRMMRDIFGREAPTVNQTDMLLKGIELARTLVPRDGETSGMDVLLESIRSFAPAISTVVAQSKQNALHSNVPRQLAAPATTPATSATAPEIIQPGSEDDMFKYYINMLCGFAAENRDPSLYADIIADNVPEEKILELLRDPDVIATLGKRNPKVLEHRAWFEAVILELKIIFNLTEPVFQNTVASSAIIDVPKNAIEPANTDNADNIRSS